MFGALQWQPLAEAYGGHFTHLVTKQSPILSDEDWGGGSVDPSGDKRKPRMYLIRSWKIHRRG